MIGYRDTRQAGAHRVRLDGVDLVFDESGVLWDPSPEQVAVLTRRPGRTERFAIEAPLGKSPGDAEVVTGSAFTDAAAAIVPLAEPERLSRRERRQAARAADEEDE